MWADQQALIGWRHAVADLNGDGTLDMVEAAGGDVMAQPLFAWGTTDANIRSKPTLIDFGGFGIKNQRGLYYATEVAVGPMALVARALGSSHAQFDPDQPPLGILFGTYKGACGVGGDEHLSVGIWRTSFTNSDFSSPKLVFPRFQVRDFVLADVDHDGWPDLIVAGVSHLREGEKGDPVCAHCVGAGGRFDYALQEALAASPLFSRISELAVDSAQSERRSEIGGGSGRSSDKPDPSPRPGAKCPGETYLTESHFEVSVHLSCNRSGLAKNHACNRDQGPRNLPASITLPAALPARLALASDLLQDRELLFDPEPAWTLSGMRACGHTEPMFVRTLDVDGDGVLDLLVSVTSSGIYWLLGQPGPTFGFREKEVTLERIQSLPDCVAPRSAEGPGCRIPIDDRVVTAVDIHRGDHGAQLAATMGCFWPHTVRTCQDSSEIVTWEHGSPPLRRRVTPSGPGERASFEPGLLPTAVAFWPDAEGARGSAPTLIVGTIRPTSPGIVGPTYTIAGADHDRVEPLVAKDTLHGTADGAPLTGWFLEFARAGYPAGDAKPFGPRKGPVITLPGARVATLSDLVTKVGACNPGGGPDCRTSTPIDACSLGQKGRPCYLFSPEDRTVTLYHVDDGGRYSADADQDIVVWYKEVGEISLTFSEASFLSHSGWLQRLPAPAGRGGG